MVVTDEMVDAALWAYGPMIEITPERHKGLIRRALEAALSAPKPDSEEYPGYGLK